MGIPSRPDPRYRLAIPDTPPELASPDSSSYSSRQFEDRDRDRAWNSAVPISPPMSNYDPTSRGEMAGKSPDDTQTRRDSAFGASLGSHILPRSQSQAQQTTVLPPIRSLIGATSMRPLSSPHSERPSTYASPSPLDRPHGSASSADRSLSYSSYFPPTAPSSLSSAPRTFEPKLEERTPYPPMPQGLPGPMSPHSREQQDQHREQAGSASDFGSGGRWSAQDANPGEYSFATRDAYPFRSPQSSFAPYLPGSRREEDSRMGYRDQQRTPLSATSQSFPSTSPTAAPSEGIPVKDGLGPKIWTGTHFLPRFVRAAEVPGEGLCYFYDDGSYCKQAIDGEVVNPHWGVTKAGKPRKRLAIACVTCREKKIKCDPDYPRCAQCEKFGRVCKFKNAPRGGHNTSPSTPPAEPEDMRRTGSVLRPPPELPRPSSHKSESVSPRTTIRPASPEPPMLGMPPKRVRIGYDQYAPVPPPPPPVPSQPRNSLPTLDSTRPSFPWPRELPRLHETEPLSRPWQSDPYVNDPQSVSTFITPLFAHLDATALRFLPEKPFSSWVQNSSAHNRKSPDDLMLIYSALALGAAVSGGPRKAVEHYSQVARFATDHSGQSLQLVQARLLLSLYYLYTSAMDSAMDMSCLAVSVALRLDLNIELDVPQNPSSLSFPCGLTKAAFAECRRRTFYACYILERMNGCLFPFRMRPVINGEDMDLQLPGRIETFEEQTDLGTVNPSFEAHFVGKLDEGHLHREKHPGIGMMGHLVRILSVWGDVTANLNRAGLLRPDSIVDPSRFEELERGLLSRLATWEAVLPPAATFTAQNLDGIATEDRATFILMHLVHHTAALKHYRCTHDRFLGGNQAKVEYAKRARGAAQKILDMVCTVAKANSTGRGNSMPPPFTGFAVLEALEVLSAEGPLANLPSLVDQLALARSVLEILSAVWENVRKVLDQMDTRLDKLAALRDRAAGTAAAVQTSLSNSDADITSILQTPTIPGLQVFYVPEGDLSSSGPRGLRKGMAWQIAQPILRAFPPEMDTVYSSLTPIPIPGAPKAS